MGSGVETDRVADGEGQRDGRVFIRGKPSQILALRPDVKRIQFFHVRNHGRRLRPVLASGQCGAFPAWDPIEIAAVWWGFQVRGRATAVPHHALNAIENLPVTHHANE